MNPTAIITMNMLAKARSMNREINLPRVFWKYNYEIDVLSISRSRLVYDYEIKVSRSDFLSDFKKEKHKHIGKKWMPNYFSFVVPEGVCERSEIPEGFGLYVLNGEKLANIVEVIKPSRFHTDCISEKKYTEILKKAYYRYAIPKMAIEHWEFHHPKS